MYVYYDTSSIAMPCFATDNNKKNCINQNNSTTPVRNVRVDKVCFSFCDIWNLKIWRHVVYDELRRDGGGGNYLAINWHIVLITVNYRNTQRRKHYLAASSARHLKTITLYLIRDRLGRFWLACAFVLFHHKIL